MGGKRKYSKSKKRTASQPRRVSRGGSAQNSGARPLSLRAALGLFAVIVVLMLLSLPFSDNIDAALGFRVDASAPKMSGIYEGESPSLEVHFVNVRQGDACIIRFPDGRLMIIDGGKDKEKAALLSYIDLNIKRDGKRLTYFDFALLTHADEDHCGGLDDVMKLYPPRVFFRPNVLASKEGFSDPALGELTDTKSHNTTAYRDVIKLAYELCESVEIVHGENPAIELIESISHNPDTAFSLEMFATKTLSNMNQNNYSPFVYLQYMQKSFLFSGDAESARESEFVDYMQSSGRFNSNTNIDVIKLGHHGSSTSTTQKYLDAITSEQRASSTVAVISSGGEYGHPAQTVLTRLEEAGIKRDNILRTDTLGNILISVKPDEGVYKLFVQNALVNGEQFPFVITWNQLAFIIMAAAFVCIVVPALKNTYFRAKKAK